MKGGRSPIGVVFQSIKKLIIGQELIAAVKG
jgi:hypothetical protein